jgi:hypothetical protein
MASFSNLVLRVWVRPGAYLRVAHQRATRLKAYLGQTLQFIMTIHKLCL